MHTTRAKAKKWFAQNFPRLRIERMKGKTAYVTHSPALVCVRYFEFKFVNAHHPGFDKNNPEWD